MAQHLDDGALHRLLRHGKDAHRHKAHMGDRRIGDQLFHIGLGERHQRGVDHRDRAQDEDQRREIMRGEREHRQREADKAVAAELQQNAGEDDRARGRRLDMRVGQPGVDRPHRHLDRERGEKREPQPFLQTGGEQIGVVQRILDVGRPGLQIDRQDRQQHQHRAEQRIEKKLERRIDPVFPAPYPDDQEHRDQHAFEEHIEQDKIERAEDADHQGFEDEEGDHVLLDLNLDHLPAGDDREHGQQGREQDEEQRDAVDPHVIGDREPAERDPVRPLDKLEGGGVRVEVDPQHDRQRKDDQRRPQRDKARVARDHRLVAARDQDEERADQRQKGDEREQRPVAHGLMPLAQCGSRYQVTNAATPISITKA